MTGKEFLDWLGTALPVAGAIVPLAIAMVQWAGKLGLSGVYQMAASGIIGLALGFFASVAFFGFPVTALDWFLALILGLVVFGGATGTYEAIKHATNK